MGLLGTDFEDPRVQGLLSLGLGLLGSRGNFAQSFSQAGQGAMREYDQSVQARQRKEMAAQASARAAMESRMMQMQIEQAQQAQQRQQALQALAQQSARSPQQVAMAANGGPTLAAAQAAPTAQDDFGAWAQRFATGLRGIDPQAAMTMQAQLQKDDTPIALGEGGMLVTRGGRKIASNPKQPDQPTAVREFQFGQQNPDFNPWLTGQKRAGATNVTVNTEKQLLGTLAQGLGKQLDDGLAGARSAVSSIQTAQTLRQAAESGKLVAGPGAGAAVFGLQLAKTLGFTGNNADEVLLNTRTAIQAMAKAELDAAQMMKGQGQITEAERDIIRRASSGNINLTATEISLLAQAMDKTARGKIALHNQGLKSLSKIPGADALLPFYQVDEPVAYQPPVAGSSVMRFDAQGNPLPPGGR